MLGTIRRASSSKKAARPYSAMSLGSHRTEYRVNDQDSLNSIRSNIHEMFDNEKRPFKQIKSLTDKTCPGYGKRIDRLCQQLNIGYTGRKKTSFSSEVDVEYIAKRYVNSKSKEKKKEEQKELLRKEVNKIANRNNKKQPRPFFNFDIQTLRAMEQKNKKSFSHKLTQHPYLKMYQESQKEAFENLSERNELQLDKIGIYAQMTEPQDWQRYQKQVKRIYSGVRSLRKQRCRQSAKVRPSSSKQNFFVT